MSAREMMFHVFRLLQKDNRKMLIVIASISTNTAAIQ
jgi:hypothetical protein